MATSKVELQNRKLRKQELTEQARTLADIANKRLRAIEKKGLQDASNAYRYIEKLHYDKDNATATDKQGRMKFNTSFRGLSYQELQSRIGTLQAFIGAQTSTIKGIDTKYRNAYNGIKNSDKLTAEEQSALSKVSYAQFADIMRNETVRKSTNQFGSKVFVRLLQHMADTKESVSKTLDRIKDFDLTKNDTEDLEQMLQANNPWESNNVTEQEDIT